MESIELHDLNVNFRKSDGKMYFTYSDLQSLPEWPEGPLLELLSGEIYLVPSPKTYHQELVAELIFQIKSHLKSKNLGKVYPGPIDVYFDEENYVIPDLIIVLKENEKIITSKNIQGSPDLIVEIVSSNKKRDFIDKRNLYEKNDVREYLVIDPEEKVIYQYTLSDTGYPTPKECHFSDELELTILPNFTIKLVN